MLVVDAGDRRSGPVDLGTLADRAWIAPPPGSAIHAFTVRACQAAGFEPRISSIWTDFRVVQTLVAAGLGVAFVPELAVLPQDGLVARPVSGDPGRRILAAWRSGSAGAPLVEAVVDALREAAAAEGA
jgi:DNA-binding transcriptional LysR family regulator